MKRSINESLAELTGIMLGDGCLSRSGGKYIIYISGHKIDDLEYHSKTTKNLFKEIFNKNVRINFKNKENALFIRFSDKKIFNQFKSIGLPVGKKYQGLKIPNIFRESKLFTAFLRGLFDTDGCVILSKQQRNIHYYPRIEITSKSKEFLLEILERLKKMEFYGSVSNKGGSYRLEIPGFKNLDSWMKTVASHNPKHINKIKKINPKLL